MRIAVYAIAKNEAKHVARWVEATKGADVRIVLDTGSEDNTYELLQEYPVEAHRATLSDFRFDVARNMALDLVPSDVDICVSLDMDEIPDPDFFDLLRKDWKPDTGRAWVMWDTGNIWANNLRVHARHGYQWKYPCHEVTESTTGVDNSIVVETCVRHVPDNDKPRSSYLPLLELGHREMPDDHRMLVYLIREYYFRGMWQEVVDHGKKLELQTGGWNIELAQSWRAVGEAYMKLGNEHEGLHWYQRNVEEAPTDLEAWMPLAFHYYEKKMWQHCYQAAIKVTELSLESNSHHMADSSMPWRMYDLLAIASWNLGKKGSAKRYARKAVELNPEDERLVKNYEFIVLNVAKDYKEKINA